MHWTKERPTRPGFYFMRLPEQTILVVTAKPDSTTGFFLGAVPLLLRDDSGVEFAGPIPLPEE
jgi:hypothetical protein